MPQTNGNSKELAFDLLSLRGGGGSVIRYSKLANHPRLALNAVCPYFTMFPLEFPIRVLRKHLEDRPVILDPFCGRGTTLFAARLFGLSAWGIDTSPVAVAVARAKLSIARSDEVLELASNLMKLNPKALPTTPFFKKAYHPEVLRDICAIREGLLRLGSSESADLLRAVMLGCLHGPKAKNLSGSGYFSNQMQRTFAPKPDYALRFWKAGEFRAPRISIQDVIRRKAVRLDAQIFPVAGPPLQVIQGNSELEATFNKIGEHPSVIITSPPYYGMRTYVQDQWLRNWFLGGPEEVDYTSGEQISHSSQENFVASLASVWDNIGHSKSQTLDLYLRIGQIPSRKVDALKLAKDSLKESVHNWKLVSVRSAKTADEGKRQADHMSANSSAEKEFDLHAVRA